MSGLTRWRMRSAGLALICALAAPVAMAQPLGDFSHPCGSLRNAYGPFDYRIYKDRSEIRVVEEYHFTPLVENLIKPMFQYFPADFDYTLRASPNHHRALIAMAKHSLRLKNPQPPGANRSVDCYFDRAIRFAPDDMVVRMIQADYLIKLGGRQDEAMRALDYVGTQAADNAFTHYSLGMLYFDAKDYAKSSRHAQLSLDLGLARKELKDRLVSAGKWVDTPAADSPAASAAGLTSSAAAKPEDAAKPLAAETKP